MKNLDKTKKMSYLPKSKITNKIAQASDLTDNFYTKSSPENPYSGPYMETSEGKYFIGTNFINKGEQLFKENTTSVRFGDSEDFKTYHKVKQTPYNFLQKIIPIPGFKGKPTENDYKRGHFKRYFSSRVNYQFGYQEINLKTYKSINSESEQYDHYLYDVGLINWALTGNVYSINQANLITLERTFNNISNLFPILNEFYRPNLQVQTNLITEGDELYYKNGTEYIGEYHIHPTKGPMEGAIHEKLSHPKLYYFNQLNLPTDEIDTTDEDFAKFIRNKKRKEDLLNKTKLTDRGISRGISSNSNARISAPTSNGGRASSGRGASSGGGGGGY